MEAKKYTYELAPALPGEEEDTNLNRMNRWERQQQMKLKDLDDLEWIKVIQNILVLTQSEAEEYLVCLRARNI